MIPDCALHPGCGRNVRRRTGNAGPALALYMCLVARAYTPVMSTKKAYRAVLRELYKAVCILPHPISRLLPFCISSQLAPALHEVGQLRRTCVLFSSPPSPVALTTKPKMSSHSYVLSACTR
jgi:hypothetical protein